MTWEAPDGRDAERLRYIADNPELLRYLYDVLRNYGSRDALDVIREVLDEQMELFPDGDE